VQVDGILNAPVIPLPWQQITGRKPAAHAPVNLVTPIRLASGVWPATPRQSAAREKMPGVQALL
jgi:hypothetical protein